ncbi:uncharacterized protein EKO05_0001807 [Ascochyta rabiei]|uniref:uncharacterized protein n=1 Tax=Didymella rabiei TaxID=5454 RepID=UPI0018FF32B0|nr:uncharacterized protein EKO05_0001807 [Ascochyta rabiei]UPX11185.1 hypothetical protein EKO05_0001807 [Ascochyta rabiei]
MWSTGYVGLDDTAVPEPSPEPARSSPPSQSDLTKSPNKLNSDSQADGSLLTQGLQLQDNNKQNPTDEEATTLPLLDEHYISTVDDAMMLRRIDNPSPTAAAVAAKVDLSR